MARFEYKLEIFKKKLSRNFVVIKFDLYIFVIVQLHLYTTGDINFKRKKDESRHKKMQKALKMFSKICQIFTPSYSFLGKFIQ